MTTTLKLYEATEALGIVRAWVDEHAEQLLAADGELPAELAALLDQAEGDFVTKVERVGLYVRELLATAGAVTAEVERLQHRADTLTRTAEGLKDYLKIQLTVAERLKVETPRLTASVVRNSSPTCVALPDAATLPDRFVRQLPPPPPEPDKAALVAAFRAGETLPDGVVFETRTHLRLR